MNQTPMEQEAEQEGLASPPALTGDLPATSTSAWVKTGFRRLIRGESGGLFPVLLGLAAIIVVFQILRPVFLTPGNLINLLQQSAVFILLGMAQIFVLLLGEMDLSIGFTAAMGAYFAVLLTYNGHFPWWFGIIVGLLVPAAIGAAQGAIVVSLKLPSFIVTLAGQLFFWGAIIGVLNITPQAQGGTMSITDPVISGITTQSMPMVMAWIAYAVIVAALAARALVQQRKAVRAGLAVAPIGITILKIAGGALAGLVLLIICQLNRGTAFKNVNGVPWYVVLVLAVVVLWSFVLARTRFGRYVYAVGGNAEAARRAGINLSLVRISCFTLGGLTTGIAGIVYASRLGSISSNIQGGQLVMYAVAAAVIGGTSLFGGRGKMIHAVLGGIVIATITNGMGLISLSASLQYMVTGLVLLAAVTIDSLSRKRQRAS